MKSDPLYCGFQPPFYLTASHTIEGRYILHTILMLARCGLLTIIYYTLIIMHGLNTVTANFVKESSFLVMMMEIKIKHWCLRKRWFSVTKYKMYKTNDWNPKSYACLYPGIFSSWWDVAASVSLAFFFFF